MNSRFIGSKSKFSEPGTTPLYTYNNGGVLLLPDFKKSSQNCLKLEFQGTYFFLFRFVSVGFFWFRFNRNTETRCFGKEAKQPKQTLCFGQCRNQFRFHFRLFRIETGFAGHPTVHYLIIYPSLSLYRAQYFKVYTYL